MFSVAFLLFSVDCVECSRKFYKYILHQQRFVSLGLCCIIIPLFFLYYFSVYIFLLYTYAIYVA